MKIFTVNIITKEVNFIIISSYLIIIILVFIAFLKMSRI